jgi:hypothetical protein
MEAPDFGRVMERASRGLGAPGELKKPRKPPGTYPDYFASERSEASHATGASRRSGERGSV